MSGGSPQKWWDVHGARRESACSPPQHRNAHGKGACRSLTISYSPFPCAAPQFRPAPSVPEGATPASGPDKGRNAESLRKEGQQGVLNRPSRTEARRATSLAALLTLNTPGPPRAQPPVGFFSASMMSSTLKLDGFCRGGQALKVATNWPTMA